MLMTLGETATVLNLPLQKGRNTLVNSVLIDSKKIEKGALFVAIKGERFDGHDFVAEAFQNGAEAAVVEKSRLTRTGCGDKGVCFPVPDSVRALQDLAAYYRGKFLFPVVAVTGTNGKTTTKEMIAEVLSTHYQVMKTEGNLNNQLGVALSMFSWSRNGEVAVVEMGTNHFGEIKRLCEIARPTHGVITNIGKGHLEFLKDESGVARAKAELLDALGEKGLAFLNGDDSHLIPYRKTTGRTITFGFDKGCDLVGKYTGMDRFGFPKMEVEGRTLRLSISGRHNLYNALAAAAVGRTFGIPWEEIQERLWRFRPVEKRTELVRLSGILVINDTYNANPSSMDQALETLKDITGLRRRIAVLGDMLELGGTGRAEHQRIGEKIAALKFDGFFCTGPEMRYAAQAAREAGLDRAKWFDSRSALIRDLAPELREGDGVLVKGSRSMKMEDVVEALQKAFETSGRE